MSFLLLPTQREYSRTADDDGALAGKGGDPGDVVLGFQEHVEARGLPGSVPGAFGGPWPGRGRGGRGSLVEERGGPGTKTLGL